MKKISLPLLLAAIILFFIPSCRKNYASETYVEIIDTTPADLTVKVNTTVAGFISDESNKPVAGAQVIAGSKQAITDAYGYFKISNTVLPKVAGNIQVVKAGYYTTWRSFTSPENKEAFVRVQMLTRTETGIISATTGGTVTAADGAKVTLPANGIVTAANGAAYTGQVHVSVRPIDVATAANFQRATPGDSRGMDTSGLLKYLKSSAVVAVELTNNTGDRLQIAPGFTATVTMPITPALAAAAPASIVLWSLDETTGLWKQESTAVKSGNTYVGTVKHFSFWDAAVGIPLVNFTAQVLNSNLQPLANVPVVITYAGQPLNAGHSAFGYTDANGNVGGAIPANASLVLDVLTTCATSAYSHPFSTGSSNISLGALTGNLGQNVVTITGTMLNCSGQPVTNGYVQTYDQGFYNRIYVNNGSISFTGLACTNTVTSYIAVDNVTQQQSTPQTVTLAPGVNNLGTVSACGTSTVGYINYTIDGVTRTMIEPADTLAAYVSSPATWTTVIHLSALVNSPVTSFQFDGGVTLGTGHKVSDIWSPGYSSGRAYAPVPLTVTITEYGNAGGFIKGSFSGMVLDFLTNAVHNVSYDFRIKRYN